MAELVDAIYERLFESCMQSNIDLRKYVRHNCRFESCPDFEIFDDRRKDVGERLAQMVEP